MSCYFLFRFYDNKVLMCLFWAQKFCHNIVVMRAMTFGTICKLVLFVVLLSRLRELLSDVSGNVSLGISIDAHHVLANYIFAFLSFFVHTI